MSNTTDATSGAGIVHPSGAHEFTPGFSAVLFAWYLGFLCKVLYIIIVCTFFGHSVVCPSIYGFKLPLWYPKTLHRQHFVNTIVNNSTLLKNY